MPTLAITLFIAFAVCTSCATPSDTSAERNDPAVLEQRREALVRKAPQRVLTTPSEGTLGEVPEPLLDKLREDLAKRLGHDAFTLQRAEAVVWPSGALGCPKPGRMYTQALVSGYHVIFRANGRLWDYRLNQRGGFTLCEKSVTPASSADQTAQ